MLSDEEDEDDYRKGQGAKPTYFLERIQDGDGNVSLLFLSGSSGIETVWPSSWTKKAFSLEGLFIPHFQFLGNLMIRIVSQQGTL